MSALAPAREPEFRSVPSGIPTAADLGAQVADFMFFPFTAGRLLDRITNPAQQSAASGSVVTNNAPTFLDGFKREVGDTIDGVTESAKTVARSAGGIVGALLPWWLWLIVGLGLFAYVLTVVVPLVKKPS